MKLRLAPITFACIATASALSGFAAATQAASSQEASLGKATMRFDGTTLRVSTGVIERQWQVTKRGLATVALQDLATGRVWGEEARSECDWMLPGLPSEGATAELKSITSKESDDEGFTTKHLEVVSEWEYPGAGLRVRHVVWAYPGAAGLRTALELKRSGAGAIDVTV